MGVAGIRSAQVAVTVALSVRCVCVAQFGKYSSLVCVCVRVSVALVFICIDSVTSRMLPYDTLGLYEQSKPSLMYRVPRVVPDQKTRFESNSSDASVANLR